MPIVDWADEPGRIYRFQYQFKRGTTARWLLLNPVLEEGEPGHEIDTGRFKIGDGFSKWSDLEYFLPEPELMDRINAAVDGVVSGGGGVSQQALDTHHQQLR